MSRSLKKGPFVDTPLLEKLEAMNPIDHPHGGGEGRTAAGQPPVSPWGLQTKGFKTRRNKRTQVMIVRDRRVK